MRVLVTGASGFIGQHCVRALARRGVEILGVSRTARPSSSESGIVWHKADLLDPASVRQLLSICRPTHILHAAWEISDNHYVDAGNVDWAASSIDLLQQARKHDVQRVVGVGSCAEYGVDHELCTEQTTLMQPVGTYAIAKYATAIFFESVGEAGAISTAWARLFFPYGIADRPKKLTHYIIAQLLKGEPAQLSNGEQMRDLLYAPEVGEAIAALLCSEIVGPVNIASGTGTLVRDVASRIGELIGRPDLIHLSVRQTKAQEAKRWVAAVGRLQQEVKWLPGRTLDDGLRETIAWYRDRSARGRLS